MEEAFITKIEGHGRLKTDWKKNKAILEIAESERLFEGIVVGRPAQEAPWITARICGVCPTAHNLCAFKAIEDALGIKPNETTILLRKLHTDAQMIQSHALHLYFLSLPDYLEIDSGLELKNVHPRYFKAALTLKEVSDTIAEVVGGRSTHPTRTAIGAYFKLPTKKELENLRKALKEALKAAETTFHLAQNLTYPELKSNMLFLSQVGDEESFNVYESLKTQGSDGTSWPIQNYAKEIGEEIREHSTAKFGFYRGRPAMVGALARLATQGARLNNKAKKFFSQVNINFRNPFYNNLAQAIEIVHFTEEAIDLVNKLLDKNLKESKLVTRNLKPKEEVTGYGALEAPRGGLYHEYTIDKKGNIKAANIITPTVQNLGSLEATAQDLVKQTRNLPQEKREKLLEMLVRAYDPCITCSVH